MIDLQTRLQLQASVYQWVNSMMSQYNISAADMEDALTKALITLQPKVMQDFLIEQQNYQTNNSTDTITADNNN